MGVFRSEKVFGSFLKGLMVDLPSPKNISYMWNFGSILGLFLGSQMVSGVVLTFHYKTEGSFQVIQSIKDDVNFGWLIRFFHVLGASAYFFFLYVHIFRGVINFSFVKNPHVWSVGVVIFFISMAVAFLGYVLPWGQMSFWGATVISKFISVIPFFGGDLVGLVWGGFSVAKPTLVRFFSFHFLFPFLILVFVLAHVIFLHEGGSGKPLGLSSVDKISFFPIFSVKDFLGFIVGGFLAMGVYFVWPEAVNEEQKFLLAKSLVTPEHIQPEWYFLAAYAVLRSVPKKLGGVVLLLMFVFVLAFLVLMKKNKLAIYQKFFLFLSGIWSFKFIFLTWLGAKAVEFPFPFLCQVGSVVYFSYFFLLIFFFLVLGKCEK